MYLAKLSLLYRVILFDLLEVPDNLYKSKLATRTQVINEHDVMQEFLRKLSSL